MQPEGLNRWSFLYLKVGVGKLQSMSPNLAHGLFLQIKFYWKTAMHVCTYCLRMCVCTRTHTHAQAQVTSELCIYKQTVWPAQPKIFTISRQKSLPTPVLKKRKRKKKKTHTQTVLRLLNLTQIEVPRMSCNPHLSLRNLGPAAGGLCLPLHRPLSNKRAHELTSSSRMPGSWEERDLRAL